MVVIVVVVVVELVLVVAVVDSGRDGGGGGRGCSRGRDSGGDSGHGGESCHGVVLMARKKRERGHTSSHAFSRRFKSPRCHCHCSTRERAHLACVHVGVVRVRASLAHKHDTCLHSDGLFHSIHRSTCMRLILCTRHMPLEWCNSKYGAKRATIGAYRYCDDYVSDMRWHQWRACIAA